MALEVEGLSSLDEALDQYETYDEYLEDKITKNDMQYLGARDLSRQLVEHGCSIAVKPKGYIDMTRAEFIQRKADAAEHRRVAALPSRIVCAAPVDPQGPLMQALAEREMAVREGKLASIVFLRVHNSRGQECSAFIDYGERLRAGGMDAFFAGSKLEPAPEDLSYYNWTTRTARVTESSTFGISEQGSHGLAFKHSADHKLIVVDPSYTLDNDQVQRTEVLDAGYLQVVIFDHPTQHKHTVQDMAVPRHA